MFNFKNSDLDGAINDLFDMLYYLYHVDSVDSPTYFVSSGERILTSYCDEIAERGEQPIAAHDIPIGKLVL